MLTSVVLVAVLLLTACSGADDSSEPAGGKLLTAELLSSATPEQLRPAIATTFDPGAVRYGVEMFRITYRTGGPTTASALVVLPIDAPGPVPVAGYLHGTTIFRGQVASFADGPDRAAAALLASAGFVTVAPDYFGLGTGPGSHPYMVVEPTVTAAVDALSAGRELSVQRRIMLSDKAFLAGFSQGGAATMWVGRALENDAVPGLRPAGIASIAGPLDLLGAELPAAFDGRLEPKTANYYLSYLTYAYHGTYRLFDQVSRPFRAPYDTTLVPLLDGSHTDAEIVGALPATLDELFTPEHLAQLRNPTGQLRAALTVNDGACVNWVPPVPVRLYSGRLDTDVTADNSARCRASFAAHGADVDHIDLGPVNHTGTAVAAVPQVVAWFTELAR